MTIEKAYQNGDYTNNPLNFRSIREKVTGQLSYCIITEGLLIEYLL